MKRIAILMLVLGGLPVPAAAQGYVGTGPYYGNLPSEGEGCVPTKSGGQVCYTKKPLPYALPLEAHRSLALKPLPDASEGLLVSEPPRMAYASIRLVRAFPSPKSLAGLTGLPYEGTKYQNEVEAGEILSENSLAKFSIQFKTGSDGTHSFELYETGNKIENRRQLVEAENHGIEKFNQASTSIPEQEAVLARVNYETEEENQTVGEIYKFDVEAYKHGGPTYEEDTLASMTEECESHGYCKCEHWKYCKQQ